MKSFYFVFAISSLFSVHAFADERKVLATCGLVGGSEKNVSVIKESFTDYDERLGAMNTLIHYSVEKTVQGKVVSSLVGGDDTFESKGGFSLYIPQSDSYAHVFINKKTGAAFIEVSAPEFSAEQTSYICGSLNF